MILKKKFWYGQLNIIHLKQINKLKFNNMWVYYNNLFYEQ